MGSVLNGLALCAGGGALDLGLQLALGDAYRTVGYVERDSFAAATLVARMGDEALDRAPVWDDLGTFDGGPWRGLVDLVSAGFPCQPFSAAGQRKGLDDARWLWPQVRRVVHEVGPAYIFVENVRGFLAQHGGLGTVLGDLADLGFDAEWEVLSAKSVGASHKRERFWLLAYSHDLGREAIRWQPQHDGHARDHIDGSRGAPVAYACRSRRPEVAGGAPADEGPHEGWATDGADQPVGGGQDVAYAERIEGGERPEPDPLRGRAGDAEQVGVGGRRVADTAGEGCEGRSGGERAVSGPDEGCPLFPPYPDDRDAWGAILGRHPSLEPALYRVADGVAHGVERSHLIGNGVVPLVAAAAFLRLADRAGLLVKEEAA